MFENAETYTRLYDVEYLPLVRFIIKHGVNENDAFDAAQQAFEEAFRTRHPIHSPRAWLRKVAIRSLRSRTEEELPTDFDPPTVGPTALELSEDTMAVLDAIRKLPKQQRQVVAWRYDGFTPSEIAEALSMSGEAVRQALHRARQTLKRTLFGSEGPEA
jgi:RNA polymerase sigma-70 factor (ECF subfamily)